MIDFNFYECNKFNTTKIIAFVDGPSNPQNETFYLYYHDGNNYVNVFV